MRKIIIIVTIIMSLSILTVGCSIQKPDSITKENKNIETIAKNNEEDISSQLEYGKPIRITVAFNSYIYEVLNEVLTSQEIGNKIDIVSRQMSPKPEANGDIARNTPEGPQIIKDADGKLYEIKWIESRKQIAIEISKGIYYRCKYLGKLR